MNTNSIFNLDSTPLLVRKKTQTKINNVLNGRWEAPYSPFFGFKMLIDVGFRKNEWILGVLSTS